MRKVVDKIVKLREGEAVTVCLMFAYSFLAMTAYNVLKPATRSKFISDYGSDDLPYVLLAAGGIIAVVMYFYSHASGRLPRRWALPVTQVAMVALLVVFWFLFQLHANWVSIAFYVFGLILGSLLISQFWTLANDIYDPRQARRLFGFIGGGASLGGAMGNGITKFSVEHVGTNNLLFVGAAILMVCALLVTVIIQRRPDAEYSLADDERGVGGREALELLRSSRHVQIIALVIGLAAVGAALIEQQLNMAAEAAKGADKTDAITAFLANIGFYVSLIGFVIQIGLTSRIHRAFGLVFALMLLPVSLGSTAVITLLSGALWAPAVARVVDSSLRYTVDKTTREVLFLPLPPGVKSRAKPFIDVTVDRMSKACGALLALVLIKSWGLHLTWQQLSYASLGVAAIWVGFALVARREYLRTFRHSIAVRTVEPSTVRVAVADATTIETLIEELSSPDDEAVLYAIGMLEALDKRHLITPLLLHHESPPVRARALAALESARAPFAARWIPAVRRLLKDDDAGVRAGAVRALAALSQEEAPALMHDFLEDPDPRVAVTAAVVLADAGTPETADAAERTMARIVGDTRDIAAAGRRDAATALARVASADFRAWLIPLIHDPDVTVAREAIRSARAVGRGDPRFVPALVSLLGHRTLKTAAREALVSFGPDIVDLLAHTLNDAEEQRWVRRHVPGTLALIPDRRTVDVLVGALGDPDGFLRYKIIEALQVLRRDHPELTMSPGTVETLVARESARYASGLTLRAQLIAQDPASVGALLLKALDDKIARSRDRLFRLLGLMYPWQDIADARYAIELGEPRARASALEYLDSLLGPALRRRVMPFIDEGPHTEKVRHAHALLRTRPRDLADTVAQLIHDDDPVVVAAAAGFVEDRQLWSLADDLRYVTAHPRVGSEWAVEAAAHALATRESGVPALQTVPLVKVVNRLRMVPLFKAVSVDELFRIAASAAQVRYEPGRDLCTQGAPAIVVTFVLEGSAYDGQRDVRAPAVVGFEEVLEGRPCRQTLTVVEPVLCLRLNGVEFLTMVSDSVQMAQGLFSMLLDARVLGDGAPAAVRSAPRRGTTLDPAEKALRLRQSPLLGRASVAQLLDLVAIAKDVPLAAGQVLFCDQDRPALYHVLDGELRLEADGAAASIAGPGATLGVAETLAGVSPRHRAVITRGGAALRLDRDGLFDVLTDHVDLLQGVFSGVLAAGRRE